MSLQNLKNHSWLSVYTTSDCNFHKDFFLPAFKLSTKYDRGVGYFTSSWIKNAAEGIAYFAKNGGRARWITSPILNKEDAKLFESIINDTNRVAIELERITLLSVEELEKNLVEDVRVELGRLIAAGVIDMRLALPSGKLNNGDFHDKFGVFTDEFNNKLSFNGSYNDSAHADINYESIRTFRSWESAHSDFVNEDILRFDRLWEGKDERVKIFKLPEAIKNKIIKFQESRDSTARQQTELVPVETFSGEKISDKLWPHQKEAFNIFLTKKKGIIEMATGTGKTRLALAISQNLIDSNSVNTIIITADGTDLLDQWARELSRLLENNPKNFVLLRCYDKYRQSGDFRGNPHNKILLTSRHFLPDCTKRINLDNSNKILLIHDEVHRLGAEANRSNLNGIGSKMEYILGLSATPDRTYDDEGNIFIKSEVGDVLYKFTIEDAIRKGVLCSFNYTPLDYVASKQDKEEIQNVYRLESARKRQGNPMSKEELWTRLAKVYKKSQAKLPVFINYLETNSDILTNCIIFVEDTEYGAEVMNIVHKYNQEFKSY